MMSTVTPGLAEPPVAVRAGADLREARERLGLSLHDVSFTLRFRVPHLEALEEGRLSSLPGNAYALAFVRTYANALGLDAEEMVRRFKTEAAEFGRRTELVFPMPMPERGLPAGAVVLLGVVLAIGAYVGWYRLSGEGRLPAETAISIPEHLAPLASQALPPVPAQVAPGPAADPQGAAPPPAMLAGSAASETPAAPNQGPAPPAQAAQVLAPQASPAPPVAMISPSSAAAAQVSGRTADAPGGAGLSPVAPAFAAAAQDSNRIVLRATADAWLLVKDRSGSILLNRVLKAGDTWSVPPRPDLVLTTGNAGGTDILVDGAPTASLGVPGGVRRDLPLDPDQIKDGKLAAALAPQVAYTRRSQ